MGIRTKSADEKGARQWFWDVGCFLVVCGWLETGRLVLALVAFGEKKKGPTFYRGESDFFFFFFF